MSLKDKIGYFLFSLDTELAWGHFDCFQPRMFSTDGQRERRSIELLLDVLDEFNIVGTWAIVGHLFYDQCEECDLCPIMDWKGKYPWFEEVYKSSSPLWYGKDIVDILLSRRSKHEIAFHGYTHKIFDESTMSEEEAKIEIQEWLRKAKEREIFPRAVIFPRNKVGYLDIIRQAGFICYRGEEVIPKAYSLKFIGKLLKHIDQALAISTPRVYELNGAEPCGLVNLASSQHFFGFNRRLELILDSLNLHKLRINRMIKGIKKAADEKKIVHIWAHPWEFQTKKDIEKLRYLFGYVADEMSKGKIQSVGMANLARKAMEL